jgi:hypothetical protein
MIYTLEYLNEDADIEIIEYDLEKKAVVKTYISRQSSLGYVEPRRNEIYFCRKMEGDMDVELGIRVTYQKIGQMLLTHEDDEAPNAFEFIDEVVAEGTMAEIIDSFAEAAKEQLGAHKIS